MVNKQNLLTHITHIGFGSPLKLQQITGSVFRQCTFRTVIRLDWLSGSVFFQSRLSLLLVSFSVSSAHVSHWPDHYVVNACIDLIKSPLPT